MIFINDLAAPYAWMTPAPIGTVEHGWIEIVSDLLRVVDDAASACPEATLDVLDISERDGDLLFEFVIDGTTDAAFAACVEAAVAMAKIRAAATCSRCGRPRYARAASDRNGR